MQRRATILLTGGIDSATCAYLMKEEGYDVSGLYVDFGQASARMERRTIELLSDKLSITTKVIEASTDKQFGIGELIGRNAFLIFSAILLGGCYEGLLVLGIHSGTRYFDCSRAFFERIAPLVEECTDGRVGLVAPLLDLTKEEVYQLFLASGIPITQTYSCERGYDEACGMCASCKDRAGLECLLSDAH